MTDDTPRSPFTQFIENELFAGHADAPTCQTVHPLLAAALDSLCEGDLDSLTD